MVGKGNLLRLKYPSFQEDEFMSLIKTEAKSKLEERFLKLGDLRLAKILSELEVYLSFYWGHEDAEEFVKDLEQLILDKGK